MFDIVSVHSHPFSTGLCVHVSEHCVIALVGGCMHEHVCVCVGGCCTINADPCQEHRKADQRLSQTMLVIEFTGQRACASQHLLG